MVKIKRKRGEDPFAFADRKIRALPTKQLLEERKSYNAEYKRKSLQELKRRGVLQTKKREKKVQDMFGNINDSANLYGFGDGLY